MSRLGYRTPDFLFSNLSTSSIFLRHHCCRDLHHPLHPGVPHSLHVPPQGDLPHQWGQGGGVCRKRRCSHHEQWPQFYGNHWWEQKRVAYLRLGVGGERKAWEEGLGKTFSARRRELSYRLLSTSSFKREREISTTGGASDRQNIETGKPWQHFRKSTFKHWFTVESPPSCIHLNQEHQTQHRFTLCQ